MTEQETTVLAMRAIESLRREHDCWFGFGPECEHYDLWQFAAAHANEPASLGPEDTA